MLLSDQIMSVSPLANVLSAEAAPIRRNASRFALPHIEQDASTSKKRSAAYALTGLALNAAGTAAAVSLLPLATPAVLAAATVAGIAGTGTFNFMLACGPDAFSAPGPDASWLHTSLRNVAWAGSHVAMGAAVGLSSGPLVFLRAARLAAAVVVGVGIPAAVFLFHLYKAPSNGDVRAFTTRPNALFPDSFSALYTDPANHTLPLRLVGMGLWLGTTFTQGQIESKVVGVLVSTTLLCAATAMDAAGRAANLGRNADQIDPAASSLLLSASVATSALWAFKAAAINYRGAVGLLLNPNDYRLSGYGLARSARVAR